MELIGLTVRLHKEAGGVVRERPAALATGEGTTATFDWAPRRADKEKTRSSANSTVSASIDEPVINSLEALALEASTRNGVEAVPNPADEEQTPDEQQAELTAEPSLAVVQEVSDCEQKDSDVEDACDSDEDGSSAGEWVTSENMHRLGIGVEPDNKVRVTCATADYSVQNVLLQMGITPLTFDGYAVRTVKLWGLICRACSAFTRESQKVFCPKCGNDTLVRVPIVVDEEGRPTALNSGRKLRTKGTVYSLPKPQGGRGHRPIFAEDELLMGGRDREIRRLENLARKEQMARDPFNADNGARAWYQRGTTATGKMLTGGAPRVVAGYGRQNPNANNFRGFGNKKKR